MQTTYATIRKIECVVSGNDISDSIIFVMRSIENLENDIQKKAVLELCIKILESKKKDIN